MSTHARLSPSKRSRWSVCPGSIREEQKYPEQESGPSAIDGTHSHTLLEKCVKANLNDPMGMIGVTLADQDGTFTVDTERAQRVKVAVDYVQQRVTEMMGLCEVEAEIRVEPKHLTGRDDLGGTVDILIRGARVLEIIDYKDGMNDVPAEENLQLEQYAFGVLAGYKLPVNGAYPFDTVRMTIIQPKVAFKGTPAVRSWTVAVRDLLNGRLGNLVAQAARCDDPEAPLVPGDTQCRYCPAKGGCSAVNAKVASLFVPTETVTITDAAASKDPAVMTPTQLAEVLEAAPLMRQFIAAAEEEALRRMRAGIAVPGFKVVNGKGSRKWALPEDEMADKLKGMGVPKDAIWKTSLVSPAQAEKLVWAKRDGTQKTLSDRQRATLEKEYIAKLAGSLTVVPESDSRNAIVFDASPMFAAVVDDVPDWMK